VKFHSTAAISKLNLPAMHYAVTRDPGDLRKVATAWDCLIREWLINSANEPALEIALEKEKAMD
jgi:DNA gyrase inhibitor GyrI